ncbi:MAG: hypothetical protein KDD44_05880, partial [Bdellovibrionales bacterium]|nr:hypothetical protein [Bdellovibrionales bacterium]
MSNTLNGLKLLRSPVITALPDDLIARFPEPQRRGMSADDTTRYFGAVEQVLRSDDFRTWIRPQLRLLVARVRSADDSPFFSRAVALVSERGRVFLGATGPNGNPPLSIPAEAGACAALVTSGPLESIVGVFAYDEMRRANPFPDDGVGILRPHIEAAHGDAAMVAENSALGGALASGRFAHRYGGLEFSAGLTGRLVQRDPRATRILFRLPRALDVHDPDSELVELVFAHLARIFGNSTSDGRHSPATKGHIAAAVRGREMLVATNQRHPRDKSLVLCAEMSLRCITVAHGW